MNLHDENAGQSMQMISFSVGVEEYGIDIQTVREVIRNHRITPLPRAPSYLKGVINLRGGVIPIIDLRERFGIDDRESTAESRVIVVEIGGKPVGMVVNSVSHVLRIAMSQIEEAPDWVGGLTNAYVRGIVRVEEKLVVLLNIDSMLTGSELQEIARSQQETEPVADRA
jgi:purine-binding chemotaxis protein CheW